MEEIQKSAEAVPTATIPNKLFFRMGEVARIIGVEPYVLRFWETEFPVLAPRKSSTGQRMFRRKDVELLLEIKHLLYEKKFTIEGARQSLQSRKDRLKREPLLVNQENLFPLANPLPRIRIELAEILKILS